MLKSFLDIISRLSRKQDGQVIVLGVGLFVLVLAALMISVDVGYWLSDKRNAQNVADATALAAVQELPDTTAAVDAGRIWANNNGINPDTQLDPNVACAGFTEDGGRFCFEDMNADGDPDLVRVQVQRDSSSFIAGAFNVDTPTVRPPAAATKMYGVASCILPWGIVADNEEPLDFYGLDPTALYVFQDTEDNTPGNYGAISIYGTGADIYKEVISSDGCPEPKSNACAPEGQVGEGETLDECQAKTGKLGNTTRLALEDRYDGQPELSSACDAESYEEAAQLANTTDCDGRGVPLGIIDAFPPSGSSADISIYGIAIFYIAGWDGPNGTGDDDGDPASGYVWGYLLTDIPATPAWEIEWDYSQNPFAPVGFFLVE